MLALFNSINSAVCGVLGINSYLQGVIVMVCINVIAVLGMSVLTGFTRLFSFGNAGFMSIGAYTAAILAVKFNVNFLLAIVIGALFAGFIAFLLGSITLRLKGDYFLITCLGLWRVRSGVVQLHEEHHRRLRGLPWHSRVFQRSVQRTLRCAGVFCGMALHPFQIWPEPDLYP